MGLILWLPLNGTIENQGLDGNAIITNNGATVNNEGKIGKCYAFDGTQYITIKSTYLKNKISNPAQPFSMSCWIYLNSDETDRVIIFGNWDANPFVNWELAADCTQRLCAGGTSNYMNRPNGAVIPKLTWTHIAVVYTGTYTKFYVNGVLQGSYSIMNTINSALGSDTFYLGSDSRSGATRLKGRLNDFRFYDHALDYREVKELSKGLVIHYLLDRHGFGNDNLLLDSLKDRDQSHNAYAIVDFNFSESLVEGKTYTVSAKINMSSDKKSCGFYHSGGSYGMGAWISSLNKSGFYKSTFTATANMASQTGGVGHGYCRVYVSNNTGGQGNTTVTGYANVEWIKVEEGSEATPWIPNTADSLYSQLGLNNGIEDDTSGFEYNGEKYGTIKTFSNSAKYNCCYKFGTENYIKLKPELYPYLRFSREAVTASIWAYVDSDIVSAYPNSTLSLFSCQEGGGYTIYVNTNGRIYAVVGTGASSNAYKSATTPTTLLISNYNNGWHMFSMTYDGLVIKLYIDGKVVATTTAYTEKTPIYYYTGNTTIFVGCEASSGATFPHGNQFWPGKLSDFRMYTTALSDADILELYQTPISLTSDGKLFAGEFSEV